MAERGHDRDAAERRRRAAEPPPLEAGLRDVAPLLPERLDAEPEDIDAGLARLVLTVVELIRQVLEHQAVQRMEGGTLSEEEVERLGLALMRLEERMTELRDVFGVSPAELNVDLGPLGRLLR